MKSNFRKKVLKNGMTVLFEKRDLPIVSVIFAVKSGSNNEDLDEKGISHFIEHMLYKGTKNRNSKKISEEIEKNGGELNGFTSEEITGYWCKMPSDKLNIALDVLSDIVKNPLFDEKEMQKERKVIFEEMSLYKDNPRLHVLDEIQKCLFGGVMDVSIIGTKKSMDFIDRKKMVKKFNDFYGTDNLVLCVVGNADFDKIVKFADFNFKIKKSKVLGKKIVFKNEEKIEKRKGVDQANLVFGYHVPLAGDKKSVVARILGAITAEGMSSRLFSEIREKRNLAYAVKGVSEINRDYACNLIYVGTNKENVEQVKKLILKEFEKVSKDLEEKELRDVKRQLIGHFNISMEDSQVQMVNLLASEVHTKAEDFYDFEKELSKVKLKDVKEMASKVKKGNYSFFALVPEN